MIRKSMPSGYDPMGGYRFSENDHAQNKKIERDGDSKVSHPGLVIQSDDAVMHMTRMRTVLAAAALYAAISPAQAEVRILASPGGQVGPFIELFDRVRAS